MARRFEDKGVVVTGAASGIGRAAARLFAAEGARLTLADIDEPGGAELAGELGADFRPTDVTRSEQVDELIAAAAGRDGGLDVVFNNAGILGIGTLPELDDESWKRVLDVDLNSVFYGCRAAIEPLRRSGGGAIVNTASISGIGGDYQTPAYNAAKAAVVNFTRSVAIQHAAENIRVNCVCPGPIATPMTRGARELPPVMDEYAKAIPMARFGRAEEVAAAVAFLASDDASYVTGTALVVDGGLTACTGQPNFARLQPG
ncbi:MAG: SDR family oxidoreductase [Proteobacteria bacterium]|nr:SDR family oxidoreductase [Pseudomonadota bacterium]